MDPEHYTVAGGKMPVVEHVRCSMDPATLDKRAAHTHGHLAPADLAAGVGRWGPMKEGRDKEAYGVAVRNHKEEVDHIPAWMDDDVAAGNRRVVVVAEKLGGHCWFHFDGET